MLLFSPRVRQLIADGRARVFYTLHLLNADGTVFRASTTHFSSVKLGNDITYVADDFIVSVDPPKISSNVDREQYRVTLADPDFQSAADAENGLVGKKMEARLGFLDPDTGLPLTDLADTFVVYKGRVDGMTSTISTDEVGESLFDMTGASPMVSLDMSKGIFLSRDSIRARDKEDACCDKIYNGSSSLVLKWGRS